MDLFSARDLFDKLCEAWQTSNLTKNKAVPDWRRFVSWMSALCTDLTSMVSKVCCAERPSPLGKQQCLLAAARDLIAGANRVLL